MRSIVLLSLGAAAAGFSFTGVPSSALANQASSATLIRDSSDPTAFSLILRLNSQNGGTTIQEFPSEQATNIPFSFTPTESGVFIIEVISNLSPISDTQEPDKIYASSSSVTVATDNQVSLSSSTSTSSSENAGTSSSLQKTDAATSTINASATQTTSSDNNGHTAQASSSTASIDITHDTSNANTAVSTTTTQTDIASSVTTNSFSSPTEGSSGQGALVSNSSESSTVASISASSTIGTLTSSSIAGSTNTNTSPVSTATLAPTAATSRSSKTGMIIGIVFGVLAFVGLCLALLVAYTRYRRRQRTDTFKRHLMFRQVSPLVFNRMASSPSSTEGSSDGDGYREYVPEDDYNRDMVEAGTVQIAEHNEKSSSSHLHSMYSEQSVHSVYSDSPSVFYTAVPAPRPAGATITGPSQILPLPTPPAPTYPALGLTFDSNAQLPPSSLSTPAPAAQAVHLSALNSEHTSASALPQLAPGWVFPRTQPRSSQLLSPKTDRQMEISDRKVRLQGKLIGLQGWGNAGVAESQEEIEAVKEQIRRLEALEDSDWALGKSNEVPIWGLGLS
ncbi:hypothetical protein GGU10DRAFT_56356 [Lentinula aff. detonsa]|uniref:Mid2 domain-containing protein n=1 Tax=Lentinula aff. detonsa TaxID=2804958 RepID=A0AA38NI95_9AGAR|nr:hypothetical protein GGU10DRAFT_56356 [Lentinula aff. detonsa]